MEWIILFLIGLIASTFGSIVGLGGGVIIVPTLLMAESAGILSYPLEPQNAVGISLMVIVFNAISSTLYNYKQKIVDLKSGLFFFIASGPATMLGAFLSEYMKIKQFYILFGLVMLITTYLLSKQKKMKPVKISWDVTKEYTDKEGNIHTYGYNRLASFLITGIAGLIGGLFGIGGGAILVPMMVLLFYFPIHVATATSSFIILLSSSLGSISHLVLGNVILYYVVFLGIGAYIGGRLGAYIATRLSSRALITALRVVIILVAVQMIYKGIVY